MPIDTVGVGAGGGERDGLGDSDGDGVGEREGDGDGVGADGDADGSGSADGDPRGALAAGVAGGDVGPTWVDGAAPPVAGVGDRPTTAMIATPPATISTTPMIIPATYPRRRERGGGGAGSRRGSGNSHASGSTASVSRSCGHGSSSGDGQRVGPGRGLPHASQNRDVPAFVVPHGRHCHVSSGTTAP